MALGESQKPFIKTSPALFVSEYPTDDLFYLGVLIQQSACLPACCILYGWLATSRLDKS
jgi:hypothetical protein